MKRITTVESYAIYLDKNRIVAHAQDCSARGCDAHDAIATKRDLRAILCGSLESLDGARGRTQFVTYPDAKTVKIGCTTVKISLIKRLLKLLDEAKK